MGKCLFGVGDRATLLTQLAASQPLCSLPVPFILSSEGDDPGNHLHVLGVRTIAIPSAKLPWVDFDSALGDRR